MQSLMASAHRPTSQTHNSTQLVGSHARLAEALAGRAAAFQESGAITAESIFRRGLFLEVAERGSDSHKPQCVNAKVADARQDTAESRAPPHQGCS